MDLKEPFLCSLYLNTPTKSIYNLRKDVHICENRLKLYKLLEEASQKFELYSLEWIEYLVKEISNVELDFFFLLHREKRENLVCSDEKTQPANLLKPSRSLKEYYEDDELGHFLLALVCSTKQELKTLVLNLETQWIQLKFVLNIPENTITSFLTDLGLKIPRVPAKELLNIKNELIAFYDLNSETTNFPIIFKIRFEAAPNMLTRREVIVKNGFLYFPCIHKYVRLFLQYFLMKKCKTKLDNLSKYWVSPEKDERLEELSEGILPHMKKLLHYSRYGEQEPGILTQETINQHSKLLFPLCMSQLHYFLQEKNHLQHYARKQYAVFLKNAGMSYEDAIELFEKEMTKKISEEDFRKQRYHYYFSHCYGQVGSMINYLPKSCEEIIINIPSHSQEHGCPFAHYDEEILRNTLANNNIRKQTINVILERKINKQYRQACCLYFNEKLASNLDSVSSPNSYYSCAMANCDVVDIEDIFGE